MTFLNQIEVEFLLWQNAAISNPVFDFIAKTLDFLGDNGRIFILLAIILMAVKKTRPLGIMLATALILDVLIINVGLKPLFSRIRPYDLSSAIQLIIPPPSDFSFPSGHTAVAFAAAAALRRAGKKAGFLALILATIMGLSRIYLMVHYPTDVLIGAILGYLCGLFALFIWDKYGKNTLKNQSGE